MNPEQEITQKAGKNTCIIFLPICTRCYANISNTFNDPCGHVTQCIFCSKVNKMCTICYGTIIKSNLIR